jgi:hypothetical protein
VHEPAAGINSSRAAFPCALAIFHPQLVIVIPVPCAPDCSYNSFHQEEENSHSGFVFRSLKF